LNDTSAVDSEVVVDDSVEEIVVYPKCSVGSSVSVMVASIELKSAMRSIVLEEDEVDDVGVGVLTDWIWVSTQDVIVAVTVAMLLLVR
jgi:hypothetical protein